MISIVDDDASVREATKGLVRSLGYNAAAFGSAEEFLDSQRVHDTSCVIIDIQMPGLGGLDLQSELIAAGHRVPVIFMTAFPEERVQARALAAGAFGFLGKPFEEEDLVACLERALTKDGAGTRER